jgi:hypothetical protein
MYTRIPRSRTRRHSRLRRNLQRLILAIKHNVLASKHDVPIDLQVRAAIALDTAKTRIRIDLRERDARAGNDSHVAGADVDAEVGKRGVARIGEAADLGVIGSALHFGVVGIGDGVVD